MMLRWVLAALHLVALGIGLAAVWTRGTGLKAQLDGFGLRRVFRADMAWGVAALLWISTGLWRLLAGLEKPTTYYLHNHVFLTKMALLLVVLLLEIRPMITLTRWRRRLGRGEPIDTSTASGLARTSFVQAWLVVLMLFAATATARGIGA